MNDNILDMWLRPFMDSLEFAITKPLSKRFPAGTRAQGVTGLPCRNGKTTIQVWCDEFAALCESAPAINNHSWVVQQQDRINRAFAIRDEHFPD